MRLLYGWIMYSLICFYLSKTIYTVFEMDYIKKMIQEEHNLWYLLKLNCGKKNATFVIEFSNNDRDTISLQFNFFKIIL